MKNPFKLPTPKELGKSDYDSLSMKDFGNIPDKYTWENYYIEMKSKHSIKFWFSETLTSICRKYIIKPIKDFKYWIVSHIIPSRRYHMLDLRQPKEYKEYSYRFGWVDRDKAMLYAMFNILGEFLNKEKLYQISDEELKAEPFLKNQYDSVKEMKAIWHWWTVDRIQQYKNLDKLTEDWSKILLQDGKDKASDLLDKCHNEEKMIDDIEDEMIARLMKVRRSMWT